MNKSVKNLLFVLKYFLFFILFYILNRASINDIVYPFAFGTLFALVWCNQKPIILAPLYLGASLLAFPTEHNLICSIATVFVCLVAYGLHYKFQKKLSPTLLGFYALMSQAPFLYMEISSGASIVLSGITVIGGTLFMFALIKIFEAALVKGLNYKLSLNEIVSAGILIAGISSGLSGITFWDFNYAKMLGASLIPLSSIVLGAGGVYFVSSAYGIGTFLQSGDPTLMAVLTIWALATSTLKSNKRVALSLAILSTDALFLIAMQGFDMMTIMLLVPSLVGCAILCFLPRKLVALLQSTFVSASDKLSMRNIVNRSRETLFRRLNDLSSVFKEMDNVFKKLVRGGLTAQQAKEMLTNEIKLKVCADCSEKNRCHRVHESDIEETLGILSTAALEKGKTTLLDVPPFLTARCLRVNQVLATLNQLTLQYKQYSSLMTSIDSSRLLIAEQLGGVGTIMQKLANEVKSNVSFDASREVTLMDSLSTEGIDCHDVAVFEENSSSLNVTIVLKNEFATNPKIEKIASKVLGTKLALVSTLPSPTGGLSIVSLSTAPKFELLLGAACQTKTGNTQSGDSYALTRLSGNRFLLALCDGMGSGMKAEKASNLAIGLIENFYQAGFDNELILSSVNKLLVLGNEEIFSALDLCVLDLQNGTADFIKLGSPCSLIKKKQEIEIVECSSLPLGIVSEMQPTIKKFMFDSGNVVVLSSDGITDSFHSIDEFSVFTNNIQTKNVQEMANTILDKAVDSCGGVALDDMTVLVCRIVQVR